MLLSLHGWQSASSSSSCESCQDYWLLQTSWTSLPLCLHGGTCFGSLYLCKVARNNFIVNFCYINKMYFNWIESAIVMVTSSFSVSVLQSSDHSAMSVFFSFFNHIVQSLTLACQFLLSLYYPSTVSVHCGCFHGKFCLFSWILLPLFTSSGLAASNTSGVDILL